MEKLGYIFILLLSFSCSTQNSLNPRTEKERANVDILIFQKELINEWNNPEKTPLKADEKDSFQGIHFFPVDLNYRIHADFTPIKEGTTHPFPTSANKIKYYKEYGKIHFILHSKSFELTLYQSDPPIEGYETSLFLPFMDETNGETTYGGGRYLDLEISDIKNKKVWIDFNQAYNPYCAYSSHYNCPIPPANNFLETQIRAGVSYTP